MNRGEKAGHQYLASALLAIPQRPVGLDLKLSQPNMVLNYSPN